MPIVRWLPSQIEYDSNSFILVPQQCNDIQVLFEKGCGVCLPYFQLMTFV